MLMSEISSISERWLGSPLQVAGDAACVDFMQILSFTPGGMAWLAG